MTSRERVRRTINFQEPDRVPIAIGNTMFTGLHMDLYCELAKYIGLDLVPPKVYEQFMMVARCEDSMARWLHADIIQLENPSMTWGYKNHNWKLWRNTKNNEILVPGEFDARVEGDRYNLYDRAQNIVAVMSKEGLYFDRYIRNTDLDNIKFVDVPAWKSTLPLFSDDELTTLQKQAEFYYDYTGYAILGTANRGQLGTYGVFAGHTIEEWLYLLMTEEDYVCDVLNAYADRAIENYELYLDAVGRYIDIVVVTGMDYGTQKSELFNPAVFEKLYVPALKRINDYIHKKNPLVKTFMHCCGSIMRMIPYFIDAGIDILNPVQTSASNMDPASIKDRFGGKITFLGGGADTQQVLPYVTPEEVRLHVKERISILAPGGGFIFAPEHNLQLGVPPENIEAMVSAALEFGKYPVSR